MTLNKKDLVKCQEQECCCKCKNLIAINCHPGNVVIGNGSITNQMGWACLGFKSDIDFSVAIFSENQHGTCELFNQKLEVAD